MLILDDLKISIDPVAQLELLVLVFQEQTRSQAAAQDRWDPVSALLCRLLPGSTADLVCLFFRELIRVLKCVR